MYPIARLFVVIFTVLIVNKTTFCVEMEIEKTIYPQTLPTELGLLIIDDTDITTARSFFHTCKQYYHMYNHLYGKPIDPVRGYLYATPTHCAALPVNTYLAALTHYAQCNNKNMLEHLIINETDEQQKKRLELCELFGNKPTTMRLKGRTGHLACTWLTCCGIITNHNKEQRIVKAMNENNSQAITILIKNKIMLNDLFAKRATSYRYYYATYFSWAAGRDDYLEFFKLLKKVGANPNIQGNKDNTLLHIMVEKPNVSLDLIQALIDCGANVNSKNELGCRPFDYARKNKIKKLLIENGAHVDWWDKLFC